MKCKKKNKNKGGSASQSGSRDHRDREGLLNGRNFSPNPGDEELEAKHFTQREKTAKSPIKQKPGRKF